MSRSLEALRGIAAQNHTESVMLSKISLQTQRDSKSVKVLALIATMYLPASLISVSGRSQTCHDLETDNLLEHFLLGSYSISTAF